MHQVWPGASKGKLASSVGQVFRFLNDIQIGDDVITYDPGRRVYLIGTIKSEPRYDEASIPTLPRIRDVEWRSEILRDQLSSTTRAKLGSISTLFLLSDDASAALRAIEKSPDDAVQDEDEAEETEELIANDLRDQSREFIKDKISRLDWQEMQELVAGLLRAMGYKTRVSPSGPDKGKDIVASPDGLGFDQPRIVVEVKHRPNTAIGSQDIRGFLGGRHKDDKGLYVSTGGFTKDARYEAERGSIPLVLLDLDDLVKELLRHYSELDTEAKALVPLTKIYWPV
jgi:restriction system protein